MKPDDLAWSAFKLKMARLVAPVLKGSAFEDRRRWPSAVVVLIHAERRITSRGDFASWLKVNGLPDLARQCLARRVGPGSIMLFLDADTSDGAVTGLCVFDLADAISAAKP